MTQPRIAIIGGSGFVGSYLVCELSRRGIATRVLTRRRERHRQLLVFPTCEVVETDVHRAESLTRAFAGCEAVVNLAGILHARERPGESFAAVHAELPREVAQACHKSGVRRLLHMSALNAGPAAPSQYLRTKGEGEANVHRQGMSDDKLAVASFRPSVIYGSGDAFFNRFATLLAVSPGVLPLACAQSRLAPVHVSDVVRAFVHHLLDELPHGERYDLCGPREYTLGELVAYTAETVGVNRWVLGLSDGLSRLQAQLLGLLPTPPFTYDNYLSLQVDSVLTGEDGFARLGLSPITLESVVPTYLGAQNRLGRNRNFRRTAGRSEA